MKEAFLVNGLFVATFRAMKVDWLLFRFRAAMPAMAGMVALLLLTTGCAKKKTEINSSRNYLIEARQAIDAGDSAKAVEALNASIASRPNVWAYFELAKQQLALGDEKAALSNCEKALAMDPEMADAHWLQGELKKPAAKRFKGRFKDPPSSRK